MFDPKWIPLNATELLVSRVDYPTVNSALCHETSRYGISHTLFCRLPGKDSTTYGGLDFLCPPTVWGIGVVVTSPSRNDRG